MKEAKRLARLHAAQDVQAVGEDYLRHSDYLAVKRLFESDLWRDAGSVFCYYGTGAEPNTLPVIEKALSQGKRLALPKTEKGGGMKAMVIESMAELSPGTFGIPEPSYKTRELLPEETDLVIVPGAAFDHLGHRLGRGGGYYDRWLSGSFAVKVALTRERLIQELVPTEEHDIMVDYLITEEKIRGPF